MKCDLCKQKADVANEEGKTVLIRCFPKVTTRIPDSGSRTKRKLSVDEAYGKSFAVMLLKITLNFYSNKN